MNEIASPPLSEGLPAPQPGASPSPRRRLDYIDALRGLACLWVLLHHGTEYRVSHFLPTRLLMDAAALGWLGVSMFLVLSGFCLYYPLARKFGVESATVQIPEFARRRATRLLPPYYAAIVFALVVEIFLRWSSGEPGLSPTVWKDVATHLLMLHNLSSRSFASINPAFWSLALESQLYVLFPFLVFLTRRGGMRAILSLTFCVSLLWQIGVYRHAGLSLAWTPDIAAPYHALPARCFEFALGIFAASLVAAPRPRQNRIAVVWFSVLILPSLWFALCVSRFGPLLDQAWGIIFASLLVLLARIPNAHFETHRALRALVWAGSISYSIYLVHVPLYLLVTPARLHWGLGSGWFIFILARVLLAVGVGWLFFQVFERPFVQMAQRRS